MTSTPLDQADMAPDVRDLDARRAGPGQFEADRCVGIPARWAIRWTVT
jgi:hypothetical protein